MEQQIAEEERDSHVLGYVPYADVEPLPRRHIPCQGGRSSYRSDGTLKPSDRWQYANVENRVAYVCTCPKKALATEEYGENFSPRFDQGLPDFIRRRIRRRMSRI